jgi:hypothetical protein
MRSGMLRPFRLVLMAALAVLVYMGFYTVPGNNPSDTAFNPERLAAQEVAVWQSAQARQEVSTFVNTVLMQREQHRYSWVRACQVSYHLARAATQFANLRNRFERVLPDLEDAAAVEKRWKDLKFDPAVVARAQLNWMATSRMPLINNTQDVAALMAEEYGLRYEVNAGDMLAATTYRAEAIRVRDATTTDPDWATVNRLLVESYRALQKSLHQARTRVRARS